MNYLKYFLFSLIVLWLFGFLYVFRANHQQASSSDDDSLVIQTQKSLANLKRLENEFKKLQLKNQHNELLIQDLQEKAKLLNRLDSSISVSDNTKSNYPSLHFEELRRKLFRDIKDISFYMNTRLDKLPNLKSDFNSRISLILAELYNLSTSDNLGDWRKQASVSLGQKVQNRFRELQNPVDCEAAPKIICDLNKACGFGCQVHHVMYCFITAYFNNRTMILESNNWRYNSKGFEAYFKPLSDTCTRTSENIADWNDNGRMTEKAIRMPIIDVIGVKPKYFPLSIPKEFSDELLKFHGDPFIWWAGNILSYLMRFNADFTRTVRAKSKELGFNNLCVGVHVRRTDKVGTEAAFHGLDEYMKHVEEFFTYYDSVKGFRVSRVVYLATDELEVLKEARLRYPEYKFVFDEANAKTASVHQRYSPESAQGVILDIYFLSQCEYLVCTFSSQVCRLAYELMQTRFADASWRFRSLDDVYYFGGQNGHLVEAIYDHVPEKNSEEIELKKGDLIGLAGNHWNGLSKGRNTRTNQEGLFPSYKVKDVIQIY